MKKQTEYGTYRLSILEEVRCILIGLVLSVVIAWLIYESVWGMSFVVFAYPLYRKRYRESKCLQRKKELLLQFKDAMQSVSLALVAGYSMENAWREAEREMRVLHGECADITLELQQMNQGVAMNRAIEGMIYEFALRSESEDIICFAEVFRFAKRSGGDFEKILRNTISRISEKIEMEQEIQTVIAGKKMEQKVMNIVPVFLLVYLRLTSADFLAPLYGNPFGVSVMTLALVGYMMAFLLGAKILDFTKA